MNTKIFKNFVGNRKMESSTFDMSFKNLGTANFGALQVKGVLPVMPKDKWSIGLDSLTKVDPMSAPAFTRIMQNTYAFYVPNACVWSYWNDFISNGSAYLDTYGNNSTNQEISDQWRPPCIPVLDLQLFSKIADGWSIPVYTYTDIAPTNMMSVINGWLSPLISELLTAGVYISTSSVVWSDLNKRYKLNLYFWHLLQACFSDRLPVQFFSFAYYAPHFSFEFEDVSGNTSVKRLKSVELDRFTVGGSFETHQAFCQYVLNIPFYTPTVEPYPAEENAENATAYQQGVNPQNMYIDFIHFCDPAALPNSKPVSPFFLRRVSTKGLRSTPVNSYIYEQHYPEHFTQESVDGYLHYYSSRSGMYGKTYQVDTRYSGVTDIAVSLYSCFMVSNGTASTYGLNIDKLPYVFRYFYDEWSSCLATCVNGSNAISAIVNNTNVEWYPASVAIAAVSSTYNNVSPFGTSKAFLLTGTNFNRSNQRTGFMGEKTPLHLSRFLFKYFKDGTQDLLRQYAYIWNGLWFDSESFSCGWSPFGFLLYNCIQARQNLERMNVPVDSFVSARFSDYIGEFVQSLPMFGLSKIYGEYFRNKAVTSAELDYCKTNGVALWDSKRVAWFTSLSEASSDPIAFNLPDWLVDLCKKVNSWVLPFETAPKSGLGSSQSVLSNPSYRVFERATQNFHYFDIVDFQDLFSVLTGFHLKFGVVSKMIDSVEDTYSTGSNGFYYYLTNLFLKHIYLPSYYNGLLHQKYQNFNQDYFSSSLLDPMSGANQVSVPTTITELRSAERKQTFWERLAMNRAFASFSEKFLGVKPYHDDIDKPLMLGSMHTRLEIGEVVQTSQTSASSSQGTRSGLGAGRGSSGLVSRSFTEYGYIILLQSHTVEVQYFQGLEKHWSPKESFLDYPFYDFVSLGNQPILSKELNYGSMPECTLMQPVPEVEYESNYVSGYPHTQQNGYNNPNFINSLTRSNMAESDGQMTTLLNVAKNSVPNVDVHLNDVFGYISRFSEWKFKFDELHGEFRNDLDYWHTFRRFFVRPLLSHEFVNWEFMAEDNELNRLFNVLENDISDKFKVYLKFNAKVRRSLPYICQPSM